MAKTGSKIAGWWAWWPSTGSAYARRFETEEDAIAYIPLVGKDKHIPLGSKYVMQVGYGPVSTDFDYYGWNHYVAKVFTEEEVKEQFLKHAAEVAAE